MRGQHAHHREHRIAPAHAFGMIQPRRADAVGEIRQRRSFCGSVMMVKCFLSDLTPAFFKASAAVSTCIKVSAVPPDLEMAMKCVFLRSKRLSAAPRKKDRDCRGIPRTERLLRRSAVSAWPPRDWSRRCPAPPRVFMPLMPAASLARRLQIILARWNAQQFQRAVLCRCSQSSAVPGLRQRLVIIGARHRAFAGQGEIEREAKAEMF